MATNGGALRNGGSPSDGRTIADLLPKIPGAGELADLIGRLPAAVIGWAHILLAIAAFALVFELAYLITVRPFWNAWNDGAAANSSALRLPGVGRDRAYALAGTIVTALICALLLVLF